MKELYKDICSKMDTKTFNSIQTGITASASSILGLELLASNFKPEAVIPLTSALLVLGIFGMYFNYNDGRNYTTDVKELRKLYDEFVHNYNELNKLFNLQDPVELQTLYFYLYRNGYLSKDKKFEFSDDTKTVKIPYIMGSDILNGKGVCRNISALFTDILNDYGIESSRLGVYQGAYYINKKSLNHEKYTKQELLSWLRKNISDETRLTRELYHLNNMSEDEFIKYSKSLELPLSPMMIIFGNHAMNHTYYNGMNYYLDPTQKLYYRMNPDDGNLYSEDYELIIKYPMTNKFNVGNPSYESFNSRMNENNKSLSNDKVKELTYKTNDIIRENKDVFERFYSDNKELYDEVSSKLLLLK